jgi:hypothetical protein
MPAECDNQDVVQMDFQTIIWVARPSFAIDNISIDQRCCSPVNADGFPKISSILSDGFDFLTKINEAGKLIL